MSLWKKIYKKIKKPTEWIEIKLPKHTIAKIKDKIKSRKSEEE